MIPYMTVYMGTKLCTGQTYKVMIQYTGAIICWSNQVYMCTHFIILEQCKQNQTKTQQKTDALIKLSHHRDIHI